MKSVFLKDFCFSNVVPFVLIAGPCALEGLDHALFMARSLKEIAVRYRVPFVFKSSFDKANRTSIQGVRGVGLEEGLSIFGAIKKELDIPILTDVHSPDQCDRVAPFVDILQIPAFLCRQTDLLEAAAATQKIINIKKGQFLSPYEMESVVRKMEHFGTEKILLCERGASFGYNNLVSDMRSLAIMAKTGYPIVFDATHSVQEPGGCGSSSGGKRVFAPILARSALAVGVAAIFAEVHEDPPRAPSDGPNMIYLDQFESIMREWVEFDQLSKRFPRFL